jgi:O-acetyl-ADP-ribose deacetylase (regulator of RNase III)
LIRVVLGDLAAQDVEAVVRPVRSDLAPATAASRDLGHRAGDDLAQRLDRMGPLPVGSAVLTPAGLLPCSFLIHVAVMSVEEPQTATSVQNALRNGLRRAADWDVASLALPPLGLGVGAMEPEEAAGALVDVLRDHLGEGRAPLELSIVVGSEYELQLFNPLLDRST